MSATSGGKGGRCVELKTLPPSCVECLQPQPSYVLKSGGKNVVSVFQTKFRTLGEQNTYQQYLTTCDGIRKSLVYCRLLLKCDSTRAETRFLLSAKRTSPFKSAAASVQSTTGSRGVRISGSNAGYTTFRGSVKSTGYSLHSPVSPSLPLPCVTVCHHNSTGLYKLICQWMNTAVTGMEVLNDQTQRRSVCVCAHLNKYVYRLIR
jgi:hypothetical protein